MMSRNMTLAVLASAMVVAACGPATFSRTRTDYAPYSAGELRQEKDGVIVELKPGTQLPPSFLATVPKCDQYGRVIVDRSGRPIMEQLSVARPNQIWHEVAITNHTDHVIRLNGVVPRLFDPGGTQYEALSRDDVNAQLYRERPCSSTEQAGFVLRSIKVFDRNIEIVPGTTSTFWIPFLPASKDMTGVWKFSVYELPVRLDSAGKPIRTTQFHMRLVAKSVTETLRRDSPLGPAQIISTSESTPAEAPAGASKARSQPTAPPPPPPPSISASKADVPQSAPAVPSLKEAQEQLAELGYDPGPADGQMGSKTVAALKRFQKYHGLSVTGRLDTPTATVLRQRSNEGKTK
jgi:hypothetical protein